jgi:hypothetical protein
MDTARRSVTASFHSAYSYRNPQALTCVLACAFMLGCSRWGAHLRIPPLYVGDLLLATAVAHSLTSRVFAGKRAETGIAKEGQPGLVVAAFLGWAMLRFVLGSDYEFVALRDFAPYGYVVVALFSASAYASSTISDRNRSVKFIELALVGHLLWVIPASLVLGGNHVLPIGGGLELFAIRADADGTVLAITACLFLMRYLRRGKLWRLAVVVASLGDLFSMTSRAPVLAAVTGLALTLCYYFLWDSSETNRGRQMAAVGMIPIILVVLSLALPQTTAGSKLLTSTGLARPDSQTDQTGLGTQRARRAAWERLLSYARQTVTREAFGVGFGPNFMIDSGASVALIGSDNSDLRSPHNYFLGTLARLGLIGLGLLGLICLQILSGLWRVRRFAAADDLVLLAAIVPPMILIAGTVGVVLEAPFGAIPFFWFLGILLSKPLPPSSSIEGRLKPGVGTAIEDTAIDIGDKPHGPGRPA